MADMLLEEGHRREMRREVGGEIITAQGTGVGDMEATRERIAPPPGE